jgi:hypothetical protein
MDIFFQDPSAIPLPPDEVRIREFRAEPWPDNRRIRIHLEITPFQVRPNGTITITDEDGTEVAGLSVIETITPQMEFTVHLRGGRENGQFTATVILYYFEMEPEPPETSGEDVGEPTQLAQIRTVDQSETSFVID